jgi:hypothetical protein
VTARRSKGGIVKLIRTTAELAVVDFTATSYPKNLVVGELWHCGTDTMISIFLHNLFHKTLDLESLSLVLFYFRSVITDLVLLPVPVSKVILSLAALFPIDISNFV